MGDEDVAEEYLDLVNKLAAERTKKTNSWERLELSGGPTYLRL